MPMSMCMYSTMVILAQGLVSCGAKRLKHQKIYTNRYGLRKRTRDAPGTRVQGAWTRLNKAVRDSTWS